MNIGIIGSGNVGKALGQNWLKYGHKVLFSYSRKIEKLGSYVRSLDSNASVGTPAEAARFGEVVVLATPWPVAQEALRDSAPVGPACSSAVRMRRPRPS
ncbi:MAG TPA: NAD(P)-binding domain-containing protein [Candidatus Methylomirabilis sp.]|nr:NAD(P)-binding domain-containing protein [Candidatus Methylomirabilis sp.]